MLLTYTQIAKMIDHSLLTPTLTTEEILRGTEQAIDWNVAAVCIPPHAVKDCSEILEDSSVKVCTVIGFPHGNTTTLAKFAEVRQALSQGAEELDIVVNIGKVIGNEWSYVREELRTLIKETHQATKAAKIIFENCYLTTPQKVLLCEICGELEADWVKTSTGFGPSGACEDDLQLMKECVPEGVKIKASGGIRNLKTVLEMREMGVSRVGTSNTAAILDEYRAQF